MKITVNIPDHLVSVVASILECGLSIYDVDDEKFIMKTEHITVNEYIAARMIAENLPDKIREKLK